jgi:hypothetical protein
LREENFKISRKGKFEKSPRSFLEHAQNQAHVRNVIDKTTFWSENTLKKSFRKALFASIL